MVKGVKYIIPQKYMFLEWKSGDVTILGMKPYYYVLKKVDVSQTAPTTDSSSSYYLLKKLPPSTSAPANQ